MDIMALILTFVISWWIILFMFLPLGNHKNIEGQIQKDSGVEQPKILSKIILTTITASILTLAFYYLVEKKIIDFDRYFLSENSSFVRTQINSAFFNRELKSPSRSS